MIKHKLKFLALSVLLLALPALVQAQFTFTTNNGAITITGYTGPGGVVTIPDSTNGYPVTSIGDGAFAYRSSLTSVTIPNSVISIGGGAFVLCASLTSVTIGNSVTDIGSGAFSDCYSLANVTIPGSVTNIGGGAFEYCGSLTAINVAATNLFYSSTNGVLFNKNQTTLIEYPGGVVGSYTIPGSVTNIWYDAFYSCPNLTSVTIPGSVTSIGSDAFYYCTSLTRVYFQGNAPGAGTDTTVFQNDNTATIYYSIGATGWHSPFDGLPAVGVQFVTTTNDDGSPGSLRQGIATVSPGGIIQFAVTGTIVLTNGELVITNALQIIGPGATNLTISGNYASRIFNVSTGATLNVQNLTIAYGSNTISGKVAGGGGIVNYGNLYMSGCVVASNTVSGPVYNYVGPGYYNPSTWYGGGFFNAGVACISNCWFNGNSVSGVSYNDTTGIGYGLQGGGASGGAFYNSTNGYLNVVQSTFSGNSAVGGHGEFTLVGYGQGSYGYYASGGPGGAAYGGAGFNDGTLLMVNSTAAGNTATGGYGGTVEYPSSQYYLSGGSGGNAGGGGIYNDGSLAITNCTLATNSTSAGGGGYIYGVNSHPGYPGSASGSSLYAGGGTNLLVNSILAYGGGSSNIAGAITDLGHNLSTGNDSALTNATDLLGQDPLLAPLGYHGGFTPTMVLLNGSPARDAGANASAPVTDQRGFSRPWPTNGVADIGAVEWTGTSTADGPLWFYQQPANATVNAGYGTTFSVGVAGQFPVAYQWRLNTTNISSATTNPYVIPVVQPALGGNYSVVVSNVFGAITSQVAVLTVLQSKPAIVVNPIGGTTNAGGSFNLSVTTSGAIPQSCEWFFGSVPLTVATNFTLLQTNVGTQMFFTLGLTNLTLGQSGNYSAQITNVYGAVTSAPAQLVVLPMLVTTQPSNVLASLGTSNALTVGVQGASPAACQWYFNNTPLSGATNFTLALTNLLLPQSGPYFARLTNAYGTVTSAVAQVTVVPVAVWGGPTLDTAMTNAVSLAVVTYGITNSSGWPYYNVAGDDNETRLMVLRADEQMFWSIWQQYSYTGNGYPPSSGSYNGPYHTFGSLGNVLGASLGASWLALQDNGAVYTESYNWYAPASYYYGGADVPQDYWSSTGLSNITAVAAGGTFNLAISNNGTVWQWSGVNASSASPVAGLSNITAIAAGYAHGLGLGRNGIVTAWGDNTYGQTNVPVTLTNVVAIAAGDYYSVALQSNGLVVCWGSVSSAPPLLTNVVAITAGLALRKDQTVIAWSSAANYQTICSNAVAITGNGTLGAALLGTNLTPFVSSPRSQTNLSGTAASFAVAASGPPPLRFQWQFAGTNLPGATNSVLTFTNVQANNGGNYDVVVSDNYGSVTSSVASLTVVLPVITLQPTNQTVLAGRNAAFSVSVSGTGSYTYQWQFNGTNLPNGIITTVAGGGSDSYFDGPVAATNSMFGWPNGMAFDSYGNLFICDTAWSAVARLGTDGLISKVAGTGDRNYWGDGGQATNAALFFPGGIAVDSNNNLFIADTANNRIRKVDTNGIITTVAGNGTSGYNNDNILATNAWLNSPQGIVADASGNLFIGDPGNNRIRKVGTNGMISTVAGNGIPGYVDNVSATNAELNNPNGVALDASGNLFIADSWNNCIRKVGTNGKISTVAGNGTPGYVDNVSATNAELNWPIGVAVDAAGDLFIDEYGNQRIRKVDASGFITTVAGNGTNGFAGDGGPAINAELNAPQGVAVDTSGNLFIADLQNSRVRKVTNTQGPSLSLNNVTVANAGNYQVVVTGSGGSVTSSVVPLAVVTQITPPVLQPVKQTGSTLALSWSAIVGVLYQVQYKTNLNQSGWLNLGSPITNAGGTVTATDSMTNAQRFYRVLLQP